MTKMTNFTFVKTLSIDENLLWKNFIENCLGDFVYDCWEDYVDNPEVYNSLNGEEEAEIVDKLYKDLLKKALDR
jgi:hypothetical protein